MTLTLPPELLTAQKAESRRYAWRVFVGDCPMEAPRFDWQLRHDDAATVPEAPYAMVELDGTVHRAMIDSDGRVLTARVTEPVYGSWAYTGQIGVSGEAAAYSPISLSVLDRVATGPIPMVAYLRGTDGNLVCRYLVSGTWTLAIVLYQPAPGEVIRGVHHSSPRGTGQWLLAMLDRGGTGNDDDPMAFKYDRGGDSWSTANKLSWGHADAQDLTSILEPSGSHISYYFRAGTDGGALYHGRLLVADGSWTLTQAIAPGENDFFNEHATAGYDELLERYWICWRERSLPLGTTRHVICFTPLKDYVTERFPAPVTSGYQVQLLRVGAYWYCASSNKVYRGNAWAASQAQKVELSDRLLALHEIRASPNDAADLRLTLDNSDGGLAAIGQSGSAYRAVRVGSQVAVSLGCETDVGIRTVSRGPWYVRAATLEEGEGRATLRLDCVDPLGVLEPLRSRAQPSWTGISVRRALNLALARATSSSLTSMGALSVSLGYFTLQPGTPWGRLASELARFGGVILRWRCKVGGMVTDGIGPGAVDVNAAPICGGDSARGIGATDEMPPLAISWSARRQQSINHVEWHGDEGAFADIPDTEDQLEQSRDLRRIVSDRKVLTAAECALAARYELYWAKLEAEALEVEIWPDFGLEIGDVVTITHARLGILARPFRILGSRLMLDVGPGKATQRLRLGKYV